VAAVDRPQDEDLVIEEKGGVQIWFPIRTSEHKKQSSLAIPLSEETLLMRRIATALLFVFFLVCVVARPAHAQEGSASLTGFIEDSTKAVIPGVKVTAIDTATNQHIEATTGKDGSYSIVSLPVGPYQMQIEKPGFKTILKEDIFLHTQDALQINFEMAVGSMSESVTVSGNTINVNTTDGSVSTVIDSQFVENLPLNGRSFNTLLQLTPGVIIAPSNSSNQGQFSIEGQRTSSNNFLIDGVSANFGISPYFGLGTSGTGGAQAFSAFGGTSSLVSVEALQEFRVETSSFAPEFGRSPGGQVILTTRAGSNDVHGGLYEYFRNNVLDANDWFANQVGEPRAPERHNDFGGFLGGPIQRDKTFFFGSYEGARLRQPNTQVVTVPSEYARSSASTQLAPFLDAYPQPTDHTVVSGVYTDPFTGNFSNPATLNAGSIRIDHTFNSKVSTFVRYNDAPSETVQRTESLNELDTTDIGTRTLTIGTTLLGGAHLTDNLRGNYSTQRSSLASTLDSFGGAVPPSAGTLGPGLANPGQSLLLFLTFDTGSYETGPVSSNRSTQLNFANDLTVLRGTHQVKVGIDYRALYLDLRPYPSALEYEVDSVPDFLSSGQALAIYGVSTNPSYFLSQATSLYAQDSWRATPRLTLTYGLRWELSPAPTGRGNTKMASWTNVENPGELALAPFGTPIWKTIYTSFAPRVGLAYRLNTKGDFVFRAGSGVFYDLNSDAAGYLGFYFPNYLSMTSYSVPVPLSSAAQYLPLLSTQPPYSNAKGYSPTLQMPRSYQWDIALEKSFGAQQALSVTYLGQAGREMLRQEGLTNLNQNFTGSFILTQNDARSNYNALQVQYRRAISGPLQALLNYTWSHSLDNASNDVISAISSSVISAANDYASSDFDVRSSFSGALTYAIPSPAGTGFLGYLAKGWSIEGMVVARSGFPFNVQVVTATIGGVYTRPNLVSGEPLTLHGSQCTSTFGSACPGGWALNPAAFTPPSAGQQGSEGRNDISGYGLFQTDLSFGRRFTIRDRANIQFRTDAFNVFNHPNFTNPDAYYISPTYYTYLKSTAMLNKGLGGLNPLFQEGGPRSLQLSLKLSF
jgi:hypothetical protein